MTPAKQPAMEPQMQRYLRDCAVLVPPGRLGADDGAYSGPTPPRGLMITQPSAIIITVGGLHCDMRTDYSC